MARIFHTTTAAFLGIGRRGWLLCLLLGLSVSLAEAQVGETGSDPHPLQPADTSSPRATLNSFQQYIAEAILQWRGGAPWAVLMRTSQRAKETADLSQIPEGVRRAKSVEVILQLKEILDRLQLPPESEIPGAEEVEADDITRWTIPNTRITIAKVEEGPRKGEFLFTAETIARIEDDFEAIKHLPYVSPALAGIYNEYARSPGQFVPRGLSSRLPAWSRTVFLEKALWQWLGAALVLLLTFLVIRQLLRWGIRWDRRHRDGSVYKRFGLMLSVVTSIFVLIACRLSFFDVLRFIGDAWTVLSFALWALIFAAIAWLIVLAASWVADAINQARQVTKESIDSQLIRILLRLVSIGLVVVLIVYASDFFGVPLTPVVAGLGVGGLAIALAVRPTLENIIGGLTMFADKPVRIGEFCRFGNEYGTVEEIGLRSTRLRRLDDTLISVPNADFAQRELTNYTRRQMRLYETTLHLRYETTPEQLRYLMTKLQEMLLSHADVSPDWLHVRFHGFGAYSLDVALFAYINTPDWLEYRAIREDINLKVMDLVKEAGTGFAIPSQTAYLGRDAGLDPERAEEAEKHVQEWREKGPLPFRGTD